METGNVIIPDATDTGQFGFNSNQNPSLSETKPSSYPNDLVHGLLAAHCADETGVDPGNSKVKAGNNVVFSLNNALYLKFKELGVDLNNYLSDWSVHEVIEGAETGYAGIVYVNKREW